MKTILITLSLILSNVMAYSQKSAIPNDNQLKTKLDSLVNKSVLPFMSSSSRVGLSVGILFLEPFQDIAIQLRNC